MFDPRAAAGDAEGAADRTRAFCKGTASERGGTVLAKDRAAARRVLVLIGVRDGDPLDPGVTGFSVHEAESPTVLSAVDDGICGLAGLGP